VSSFPLNNVDYQSVCQECQLFFGNAFFGLQMKRELRIICLCFFIGKYLHKGTSKNWILINFIEKPFFNQFMSVFAMKF